MDDGKWICPRRQEENDTAKNSESVDSAYKNAKQAIDTVPKLLEIEVAFNPGVFSGRFVSGDRNISAIIRSHDDLVAFFERSSFFWRNNTPIWEHYDNDFFENHALVIYLFIGTGSIGYEVSYHFDGIRINSKTLTFYFIRYGYSDTLSCISHELPFLFEVEKIDIEDATTFEIKTWNEKG